MHSIGVDKLNKLFLCGFADFIDTDDHLLQIDTMQS